MPPLNKISFAIKTIRQLGLTQVTLHALYKLGLKTGHFQKIENRGLENRHSLSGYLFRLPDRDQLARILGKEGQQVLLAQAEEIVSGVFRMFGGHPVELKLIFDRPLQHWTDYETGKAPIPETQFPIPDIKFLWEPARFGWAYTLGRAFYLTQNEAYAETFWMYFERFIESNPANMGPNWMSAQEVAIRLMAFVWADQVFETAGASSAERRARLAEAVAEHGARIPPTLIYARAQNNNHLLTEAAGLYTAGFALGHSRWRALGWRWLNWAFCKQIDGYGEYIQHSVNYHRVMLQVALWVNAIKDVDWPRLTAQSLGRATHWLVSMLDPASGRTPNLGSNDGALILPLSVAPFSDFRPTAQAAARAFLRFQIPSGSWDETSLWLGLDAHERTYDPGLYLTDHPRGRVSWALLRASTFPSRLGHIDQLHLDLWWRGLNIAQDAGTYRYNADPPWDNSLMSGYVHNTVTVDGRDQMTRAGRFMTLDWFPAYSETVVPIDESILGQVKAHHKGYRGISHERTVTVYDDGRWVVEDELVSKRPHAYRLHWLLPDWQWKVENRDSGFRIRIKSPLGWIKLDITSDARFLSNASPLTLTRAGEVVYGAGHAQPFEGWFSPTYGSKVPALSLAFNVQSEHSMRFRTEFIFPDES